MIIEHDPNESPIVIDIYEWRQIFQSCAKSPTLAKVSVTKFFLKSFKNGFQRIVPHDYKYWAGLG